MGQMAFFFDMTSCTGCRCCQVACKEAHDLPVGVFFRTVSDFEGGLFPHVWAASLSSGCNHCDDPQCMKNCPVAAYTKQEGSGIILQDVEMCIGCKKCIQTCPYDAPAYNPVDDTVRKCDACATSVLAGFQPACVASCSTRALRFGEREEWTSSEQAALLTFDLKGLPDPDISRPGTLVLPKDEMRR